MKKKILALTMAALMSVGMLAGCGSSSGGNANAKYQVGVIQLVQHPALDAATKGFKDALKKELGNDVSIEVKNASGDTATCATIANTFVSSNKSLIMANATPALQAASQATADIPVLGTSVTDYATALDMKNWTGKTGTNVSGTSDLAPLNEQAAMVKELFPDAKNVGILYCNSEANSKFQADKVTAELEKLGYTVNAFTFSDSNDVANVTQNACDASDVLYIPTDNTAASCAENINNVALSAKKPIIAGEENICKGCGVATLSIDYYDLGYQTGVMAAQVLRDGKKPGDMEVQTATKFTKEYNESIVKELGITIPDGYEAIKKDK
ncbi:MAG TPA: ABC transporter substrate-binding protein [Lachnospiraceae bacterium]|jgi:putative ABC transport system substrate-binding protein|nr:ABC transporter substrate-binding protein [Lachnospiraceae bacterium]MDY5703823.1 ABC transporter substrate-binding protein [Lachnospiraceae bacterium]HAN51117.1 ABC transporter substrate-binding protein [Lachnospiraceae bacterium]HBE07539.1 ABC transporter substrate-binding protein [Lachnospiraceae bacterium]